MFFYFYSYVFFTMEVGINLNFMCSFYAMTTLFQFYANYCDLYQDQCYTITIKIIYMVDG